MSKKAQTKKKIKAIAIVIFCVLCAVFLVWYTTKDESHVDNTMRTGEVTSSGVRAWKGFNIK